MITYKEKQGNNEPKLKILIIVEQRMRKRMQMGRAQGASQVLQMFHSELRWQVQGILYCSLIYT